MKNRWTAVLLSCVIVCAVASTSSTDAGRLYWSKNAGDLGGHFDNTLGTVRTDGSDFYQIYHNANDSLGAVAVDSASRRLYWIESGMEHGLVRGDANSCQSLSIEGPSQIALDVAGGKIYWTEFNSPDGGGRIHRANLDLSSAEVILDGLSGPWEIGVDSPGGKLYWYEQIDDVIKRSNLDGSDVELQFEVTPLHGMQIDPVEQKIYWTDWSPGSFRRADFDGSNVEELAPQVKPPFVVDVSSGTVYWQAGEPIGPEWYGIIKRVDLDGSNESLVMTGEEAASTFLAFDPADEVITISCGAVVPALGLRGAGVLLLLLLVIGTRALIRP